MPSDGSGVPAEPEITVRLEGDGPVAHGTPQWHAASPYDAIGGAGWTWTGGRLTADVDRYGTRPLFYRLRDGGVQVSPSLVRLARPGGVTFDDAALAVFMRLGFFVGDDTPFREIRVLPPGGRLEWERGVTRVTGAPAWPDLGPWTRDAALDAYIAAFRAAVRRALPVARSVVPLSGGRDSRHILFELLDAGAPPDACLTLRTYPPRGTRDLEIAATVARALGMPHRVIDQDPSRVRAERRKNVVTHFCADEHAWFMALADAPDVPGATLWDGIGGDVLSNGHRLDPKLLELVRAGQLDEAAAALLREDHLAVVSRAASSRLGRDVAAHRLVEEMRRHAGAHNPVTSFFFWNRTRREIALVPFGIMSHAAAVITPYLERGVFDVLASLPAELLIDKRFHTDAIRRAYPAWSTLPFDTESGLPARRAPSDSPDDAVYYRRLLREGAWYVTRASAGRLVRRAHLVGRAAWWMLRGDFTDAELVPVAVYLAQLEALASPVERHGH